MGTDYVNTQGARAVLYCRVSTDRQAESGHSLGAQRDRLEAWARDAGVQVVEVVVDGGASGRSMDRVGWKRVEELVAAGEVDVVAAVKGDRIARSLRNLLNIVSTLDSVGVSLALTDEDFDSGSEAGTLMLQVRGACSEYEVALCRRRTVEAMAAARERGVVFGRPPLGWNRVEGKLVPNDRYPVVERAHRLRAQGLRLVDSADDLNRAGVPTGSGRGSWAPGNVARLLKAPLVAA
ncbi:MAG: recombinase [Thermoleophilia bacterium]|jgi:site-specific DNA recombinase|nr:recombinase [Thermoleophilia bacterium]